ncbi:MAG: hypothetical protein AB8G26_00920 [Ilumatobacter sp.]
MPQDDTWYWDLRRGRAVPAAARGIGSDMLGPYPTRDAAENWKSTVDERNDAWAEQDEDWDDSDPDPED